MPSPAVAVAYLSNAVSSSVADSYAQAPESVALLVAALESQGFPATSIDVASGPHTLEAAVGEGACIVNYVERALGADREVWFVPDYVPADLYAGPTRATLELVTAKDQTKAACAGVVRMPRHVLVTSCRDGFPPEVAALPLPLIVKPNREGNSTGISDDSVATTSDALVDLLADQLKRFPDGVLVEEYVAGTDVTVAVLETSTGQRCLPPVAYFPRRLYRSTFGMYDYRAKNDPRFAKAQAALKHAVCPAQLPRATARELEQSTLEAVNALGVRAFGRADFRITEDGRAHLLEVNALPDVDPTSGFYIACRASGRDLSDLVGSLVVAYPALRKS